MLDLNSVDFISQAGSFLSSFSSIGGNSSISSFAGDMIKNSGVLDIFGFLTDKKTVALFDENNKEVLANCDIHSLEIRDEARLAEQPLEDGTNISDHKVFLQKEATVLVYMPENDYASAISELYDLYSNNKFLKLQAKSMVLSNLQIVGLPHEESNQNIYRMTYRVQLKEAITVKYSIRGYNAKGGANASRKFTNNPLAENDSVTAKGTKFVLGSETKSDGANPKADTAFAKSVEKRRKANLMVTGG